MRIAVCEDNNIVAAFMEDYIASMEAENIEYEIFTSGDDLIHYMEQENVTFNILFMDIEMPGRNGIETSAYVREKDKNALIIFITDHKESGITLPISKKYREYVRQKHIQYMAWRCE